MIFSKITKAICCHDFQAIQSGNIFHFTKHANNLTNHLTVAHEPVEVFTMLVFTYKTLKENFVLFKICKSPCGRPLFILGHGVKMHLNDLHLVLSSVNNSIEVLKEICLLEIDAAKSFSEIMWNFNNDHAVFRWLESSFKVPNGIKMLLELRNDVLADDLKNIVQLFIPANANETNGLLLIQSGVYGFLISAHVLHVVDRAERLSIVKSFEHLHEREELINVIGKIFRE